MLEENEEKTLIPHIFLPMYSVGPSDAWETVKSPVCQGFVETSLGTP